MADPLAVLGEWTQELARSTPGRGSSASRRRDRGRFARWPCTSSWSRMPGGSPGGSVACELSTSPTFPDLSDPQRLGSTTVARFQLDHLRHLKAGDVLAWALSCSY